MILREFPDLQTLKRRIADGFHSGRGWPTCILNVRSGATAREDIRGPFSLFFNLQGESIVRTDAGQVRVNTHNFVLTNSEQHYSLYIPRHSAAETLNIHFSQEAFDGIFHALTRTPLQLLDQPLVERGSGPLFPFHSAFKAERLNLLARQLLSTPDETDSLLIDIAREVGAPYVRDLHRIQQLQDVKASTRQETLRRLHIALDLMHTCYDQPLTVEDMALASAMSKFHFLRSFKEAFGLSPHQYLKELRTRRALELLRHTSLPLADICLMVGMENASSLSRLVQQQMGLSPTQVRLGRG